MKIHCKLITISLISVLSGLTLSGCSSLMSSKMPAGSVSMKQAYNGAIDGTNDSTGVSTLNQVRNKMGTLRARSAIYNGYTRTQQNEIDSQFPQLPNPSVVMYVYPHEAGTGYNLTPVPGYSTVFPLYQHVYYAMPGEVDTQ